MLGYWACYASARRLSLSLSLYVRLYVRMGLCLFGVIKIILKIEG